ncbi:WD repeat domain phosphoinositide-interacting protein 1-like [Panonychus citri]|uniref:WD repeat domain phosphoinositide-interacting protein 1-like n=1 Tax=Panonychus citri TaxID=50023 RepID=UPI002306F60F|nr:WD repeat domain phosphoinositide-interacting protein 1-like [Panonychus citri]XP_053203557.1 WD repeat domain phosphoinositide-interacting protein 1-like [Panonychus citri]XP_053203558.1 WD repeat domain phosphoinositide-interacting protein 1-like [Panonychus citri]XP_053203961.1 WD repeat domain phosphoinositide-interacting protein 1-like [Panonychus citri]XP_053203970.1 WD repeat domain phosphoinositide-interacting protein 1-like [Panonychus citri]
MAHVGDVENQLDNIETEEKIENESDLKVFSLRFEKQSYQLVVGTTNGYRLVNYFDPTNPVIQKGLLNESIKLIELIPKTMILTYVTTDSPNKVNFYEYHETDGAFLESKLFSKSICALRASTSRIAIAVESGVYLFSSELTKFMQKLHYVILNVPNPHGLIDLSENDFNAYLGYPCSAIKGEVEIFDCRVRKSKVIFEAHISPIVAISFSPTGRSVATASEKGTLIRVHIVFTGECVYEFRRSLTRTISINSLGFGLDSTYLGVTSSSTTIHIFKLEQPVSLASSGSSAIIDAITRTAEAYLPTEISKLLHQERAFAYAALPVPGMDTISMIHRIRNSSHLIVATFDGFVYIYTLDDINGGECRLIKNVAIEKDLVGDLHEEEWVLVD